MSGEKGKGQAILSAADVQKMIDASLLPIKEQLGRLERYKLAPVGADTGRLIEEAREAARQEVGTAQRLSRVEGGLSRLEEGVKKVEEGIGKVGERIGEEAKKIGEEVKKRMEDMERRWERAKAFKEGYEKAAKEFGGGRLPLDHHKLNVQRDIVQQSVIPELRGVRQDLRDIGILHYLALVEERRGVPPGTLLRPYVERFGLGEVLPEIEKPTTIAEKRAFIARLRGVD